MRSLTRCGLLGGAGAALLAVVAWFATFAPSHAQSPAVRQIIFGGTRAAAPVVPFAPTALVVQGHSIPAGYGTTGYGAGTPIIASQSYANLYTQTRSPYVAASAPTNGNMGHFTYKNRASSGVALSYVTSATSTILADFSAAGVSWFPNKIVLIDIGYNDRSNPTYYPSGQAQFATDLFVHTDALRAAGIKVIVAVPEVSSDAALGAAHATWDTWCANLKALYVAAIGTHVDAVWDTRANAIMGLQANTTDLTWYQDGVHYTDAGHGALYPDIGAIIEALSVRVTAPSPLTAWSTTDKDAGINLTNSNFTANVASAGFKGVRSANGHYYGKRYGELKFTGAGVDNMFGLVDKYVLLNTYIGATSLSRYYALWSGGGTWVSLFTSVNSPPSTFVAGDVFMFHVDFDNGVGHIGRNGVWPSSGDPVTGANPTFTFPKRTQLWLAQSPNATNAGMTLPNGTYSYPIPAGASGW